MKSRKIGVLIGSLRTESYSRKIAKVLMSLAPDIHILEEVAIGQLPLYNQDIEDSGSLPEEWIAFRNKLDSFDAIIFVTPEYNRSIPGVLKNALDVASRPAGKSRWNGKPALVVSVSPGNLGAFGANHHLRQSLVFLNMPTLQQPEAYIGNVKTLFNAEGLFSNDNTLAFLKSIMDAFVHWIELNLNK